MGVLETLHLRRADQEEELLQLPPGNKNGRQYPDSGRNISRRTALKYITLGAAGSVPLGVIAGGLAMNERDAVNEELEAGDFVIIEGEGAANAGYLKSDLPRLREITFDQSESKIFKWDLLNLSDFDQRKIQAKLAFLKEIYTGIPIIRGRPGDLYNLETDAKYLKNFRDVTTIHGADCAGPVYKIETYQNPEQVKNRTFNSRNYSEVPTLETDETRLLDTIKLLGLEIDIPLVPKNKGIQTKKIGRWIQVRDSENKNPIDPVTRKVLSNQEAVYIPVSEPFVKINS